MDGELHDVQVWPSIQVSHEGKQFKQVFEVDRYVDGGQIHEEFDKTKEEGHNLHSLILGPKHSEQL